MPVTSLENYREKYEWARLDRSDEGILEVTLHSDGGTLLWGREPRTQMPDLLFDIANDHRNRVVILTGTGDSFIGSFTHSREGGIKNPRQWNAVMADAHRLPEALLSVQVPVIAAVNGPARVHSQIAVLSDIVLAAREATFQDFHVLENAVPGDGVGIVWMHLLGPNRGRYFLFTGQELTSDDAFRLGVVSEVLAREDLMPRARELATGLLEKSDLVLRYTRRLCTQEWRRVLYEGLEYGLLLEGAGAVARSIPQGDG